MLWIFVPLSTGIIQHKPNILISRLEYAGPEVWELQKTACSSLTQTQIINKHPALHFACRALLCCEGSKWHSKEAQSISVHLASWCWNPANVKERTVWAVRWHTFSMCKQKLLGWFSGRQMFILKTITKDRPKRQLKKNTEHLQALCVCLFSFLWYCIQEQRDRCTQCKIQSILF